MKSFKKRVPVVTHPTVAVMKQVGFKEDASRHLDAYMDDDDLSTVKPKGRHRVGKIVSIDGDLVWVLVGK